jgi:hypothetical protein
MHQLMLFMLTAAAAAAAAAASSSGISSSYPSANAYESVRLLNEYGSAAQLDAARAACFQRGQCVVAIRNHGDGSIWIISPRPDLIDRPLNLRVGKSTTPFVLNGGDATIDDVTPLLQAVTSSPVASVLDLTRLCNEVDELQELSTPPAVYVVCSGVATDAAWLVQQLRLYGKHIADRYSGTSTTATPAAFARVVAALKRRFWSYPETTEYSPWTSPGYDTLLQGYRNEQGQSTVWWGRPLGVCTMVLSVRPDTTATAVVAPTATRTIAAGVMAHLELVEPSGLITTLANPHGPVEDNDDVQALGMGPDSAAVIDQLQALRDQYRPFHSDATLQEWICAAFTATAGRTSSSPPPPLQVEIYTSGGTVMRRLWSDSSNCDPAP